MDRLDAMSILVAVSEAGSMSAAARKLGVPLPSVSRKISDLEAHLEAQLLIRTTRKLSLTDAGEAFVVSSRRILEQVADAERMASGEASAPKGELVVAAPIVFGRLHVLPVIAKFLAQYPEINVRLVLSDRNADIVSDSIDVAVRIGGLPDSSLQAARAGFVRRVVCGSPAYFARKGTPKSPDDLPKHDIVSFDAMVASGWTFPAQGRKRVMTVALHPRLVVNTAETAVDAAIAGVGLTRVLSYQAQRSVGDRKLAIVLQEFEPEPLPVNIVYAAQGQLARKTRAFIDFALPVLRKQLGEGARA